MLDISCAWCNILGPRQFSDCRFEDILPAAARHEAGVPTGGPSGLPDWAWLAVFRSLFAFPERRT